MADASPFGWVSDLAQVLSGGPEAGRSAHKTHPLYLRFGALPPDGRPSTWRREWMASGRTPRFGFENLSRYDFEPGVA